MEWVSDSLHDLIGLSDATTVQYLVSLAQNAASAFKLGEQLISEGLLEPSQASRKFIQKLHD